MINDYDLYYFYYINYDVHYFGIYKLLSVITIRAVFGMQAIMQRAILNLFILQFNCIHPYLKTN